MRYWMHWHNVRYEAGKRVDRLYLKLARHMPGKLRMWVVVDAANTAIFDIHPRPDGYAGPDGLTFSEICDGAIRDSTAASITKEAGQ